MSAGLDVSRVDAFARVAGDGGAVSSLHGAAQAFAGAVAPGVSAQGERPDASLGDAERLAGTTGFDSVADRTGALPRSGRTAVAMEGAVARLPARRRAQKAQMQQQLQPEQLQLEQHLAARAVDSQAFASSPALHAGRPGASVGGGTADDGDDDDGSMEGRQLVADAEDAAAIAQAHDDTHLGALPSHHAQGHAHAQADSQQHAATDALLGHALHHQGGVLQQSEQQQQQRQQQRQQQHGHHVLHKPQHEDGSAEVLRSAAGGVVGAGPGAVAGSGGERHSAASAGASVVPSLALRNASASRSIGGALVVPAPVDVAASAASGGDSAVAAAAAAAAAQLAVMRALEPVHHRKMRQFTFSTASVVTFLPFPRRLVEERNRTHEPGVLDAWLDAVKREFHSGLNVTNETLGRPLRYGMCNCMKLVAQTTAAGPMLMSTMAAAAAVVKELPNLEHPSLHAALQQHSPVPSSAGDMLGVGAPLRRVYVFEFCKHDARDSLWCGYHSGNPRPRRRVGALGSTGGSGSETYGQLEAMTAGGADSAAVSGATTSGAADALPYVDLLHASHSSFAAQQRMMQQQQQQHEQHRLAAAELLRTLPVSTQQAQLQAQQRSAVASQSSSGPVLHSATDDHVRRIEQSLAHHPRLGDVVSRERGGQDARPVEARGGAGMAPDVGEGDIDDAVLNMHAAVAAAAAEGASASPRSSASSSSASSTSSSPPPPPPVVDGAREPDADRGDGSVAGRSMPAAKRVRAVRGASGALRAESALSAVARTLAQAERAIGGLANGALDAHSHDAVLRVESLASHLVQVLDGIAARCGEARARADELLSTVARLTAPPHSNGE